MNQTNSDQSQDQFVANSCKDSETLQRPNSSYNTGNMKLEFINNLSVGVTHEDDKTHMECAKDSSQWINNYEDALQYL